MRLFHPEGPSLFELTVQALSSIERGYDRLAPRFDRTPFRTPDSVLRRCLEILRANEAHEALDVCCGTGAASALLVDHAERVVGVDLSAGMLEVARERVPAANFVKGDALGLPFADESFDVAVSFGAFGHFLPEQEPRLASEVFRVLRPGGRFIFVTADPPSLQSPARWAAHAFNAAMRVRNAIWKPTFVMYYLSFLTPRATNVLSEAGFAVDVQREQLGIAGLVRVVATRPI